MAYPDVAVDGQRLSDPQNAGAVGAFTGTYGANAGSEWARQHNAAIGFSGDPGTTYWTAGGWKTITDIGVELRNAGYGGPWDEGSMIAAYGRASGLTPTRSQPPAAAAPAAPPNPAHPAPITPTAAGPNGLGQPTIAGLAVAGNPGQWLNQSTHILGVLVPNTLILGGGVAGLAMLMLQQRPVGRR